MYQVDPGRVLVFGGTDDEVSPSPAPAGNIFLLAGQGLAKQAALGPFTGTVPKTCGQVSARCSVLAAPSRSLASLCYLTAVVHAVDATPHLVAINVCAMQGPGERFGHAACLVETGSALEARPVMLVVGGIHPHSRATLRSQVTQHAHTY